MADINYENVDINFSAEGSEDVLRNLQILYTTPEGTVPFMRDFGISLEIQDQPINAIQAKMVAEYTAKTRKFEPRATVEEVTFVSDGETGSMRPKVVISSDS
ncbi:hypothetical protein [Salibacterium halotolerans]|uniref:IraD/Gp25-like domain-containing protein n=1 Tax=Salibacterium halotolerans TaxID=1884432 RepID=A0A1I5MPL0_9BACI|nr:hypothetical protein [Salibacterium halotolerans]SFP11518.1 hypothetical protein SAMN05518683_102300 [Salibacterium halotolerans]